MLHHGGHVCRRKLRGRLRLELDVVWRLRRRRCRDLREDGLTGRRHDVVRGLDFDGVHGPGDLVGIRVDAESLLVQLLLLLLMLLLLLLLGHCGLILLKGCVRRDLMTRAVHRSGHRRWNDLVELLVRGLDAARSDLLHQVRGHRVRSVRNGDGWRGGSVRPRRGWRYWRPALI